MEAKYRDRVAVLMSQQDRSVQLDYAIQHLKWLEEFDSNSNLVRALGFSILNVYGKHTDSPFFHDVRILRVSMTVGRLSRNLGLKAVMQQIFDRGQFPQLAEFYIKWAEIYAEEKDFEQFDKIYRYGIQKRAEPRDEFETAFRQMKQKYFGNMMDFVEEETQQLFAAKVVPTIPEGNKENANAPSPLVLGGTSFTQNFYSKAMQDFSNTLPVAPPRAVQTPSNSDTVQKGKDDTLIAEPAGSLNFQVYVDEQMDVDHKTPKAQKAEQVENRNQRSYEFKKPEIIGHAGRIGMHPPAASGIPKPTQSFGIPAKNAHQPFQINHDPPFLDSINEEMVAGTFIRQGRAGIAASTPANPLIPTIEEHMFDVSLQQERTNELDVIFPSGRKSMAAEPGIRQSGPARCGSSKVADSKGDFTKPSLGGSLVSAVSGLTIGEDGDDDNNEPTGRGLKSFIQSEINPWDDKVRQKIMNGNRVYPTYLHDCAARMKRITTGTNVVFEGEQFAVLDMIGEGGFAKVFRCNSEDGNTYALKVESPSCRWEVYVCELVRSRVPAWLLPGVMTVTDAYIYPNMSAIIYEYHQYGNLLDLSNALNPIKSTCSGLLTVYLSWEIARILKEVHAAKIIHGDVKPDNFMVLRKLDESSTPEELLNEKNFTIKLIDWGRAIDMSALPGRTFTGRAGTECFDCFEMMDGRPWTYQTDFFGFMGTMHVLLFGQYIKTTKDERTGRYSLLSVIKRRCNQRDVLQDVFQMCLNIPDCDHMPDWTTIITGLAESVRYSMNNDRIEWKTCAREFNQALASRARK